MMPEMDGFQVLRKIREFSSIPIIMLTAKGDVADKVVGLELGADDYLSKPFEPAELLARIQSILRRTSSSDESLIDNIEFEGLSVDKIKQIVKVDGEPINLSTAELEALFLFVNNANKPLSRDFLVENLRGIQWQTCDRSVDVLVSRLRNKLESLLLKQDLSKQFMESAIGLLGSKNNCFSIYQKNLAVGLKILLFGGLQLYLEELEFCFLWLALFWFLLPITSLTGL